MTHYQTMTSDKNRDTALILCILGAGLDYINNLINKCVIVYLEELLLT